MRISFFPVGDRSQASARLRAHMLSDALRSLGHEASADENPKADLVVFQKIRVFPALARAKQRRARVVYDFDDHYLLHSRGTRDEIMRMLNLVDVVTVGSPELLAACRAYHPNVRLFENPLDVLPESRVKDEYSWKSRVGWFGNRANLVALDMLKIDRPVTKITAHGDVEWTLDTIDEHLRHLDLVLLPVEETAWTLAKNANRLLKCCALGVPFLAAATPEHRRAVELLGLPSWLLVPHRDDWRASIERLRVHYDALPEIMARARARAFEEYGTEHQARQWLHDVTDSIEPGLMLAEDSLRFAKCLDVFVLGERSPDRCDATISSVRSLHARFHSVESVSAWPHRTSEERADNPAAPTDFFSIYHSLASKLDAQRLSNYALILQAGVSLRPLALEVLHEVARPDAIVVLGSQVGISSNREMAANATKLVPDLPRTDPELLLEPVLPLGVLIPAAYLEKRPIDPNAGALWAWDLLLGAMEDENRIVMLNAPVALVAPETYDAPPLEGYALHLRHVDPVIAADLPRMRTEWGRLKIVLTEYVVSQHPSLFKQWVNFVASAPRPSDQRTIARLETELRVAKKQIAKLAARLSEEKLRSGHPAPEVSNTGSRA